MELILSVLLLAAGVCGTGYISDKRKWNNGICKKSGKPWKYFDSDYGGSRGYKDWAGNYIWTNSAVPGQPATLLGYPVFENPNVSAVGTGTKSVLFGHNPSFKVRVAGGIRVDQSADYAFNTDTVTYRGLIRLDGALTFPTHIMAFRGGAS
jgi:HK97 family phage major capsid protein